MPHSDWGHSAYLRSNFGSILRHSHKHTNHPDRLPLYHKPDCTACFLGRWAALEDLRLVLVAPHSALETAPQKALERVLFEWVLS